MKKPNFSTTFFKKVFNKSNRSAWKAVFEVYGTAYHLALFAVFRRLPIAPLRVALIKTFSFVEKKRFCQKKRPLSARSAKRRPCAKSSSALTRYVVRLRTGQPTRFNERSENKPQ
ncbi:MAG: hypothetical protein K2L03_06135 [Bacteroidales bacterium]|nr:hypothetical protein [Bacteroidales bacterium]